MPWILWLREGRCPTPNGEAGAAGQVKHLKGPGSIVAAGELLARLEGMELSDDFGEDSV